jgi:hypothetical protein
MLHLAPSRERLGQEDLLLHEEFVAGSIEGRLKGAIAAEDKGIAARKANT